MEDESFVGYILRLTELNSYDTPSWIVQLAGIGKFFRLGLTFNCYKGLDLSKLAQLTGADVTDLTKLLFIPDDSGRRKAKFYVVFKATVFPYVIRRCTPKICPGCLQDTGYTRKIWELAPVTACPIHKCLLMDSCPHCQAPISWQRPGISVCRCGTDWREYRTSLIEDSELAVARQIYHLCGLITGTPPQQNPDLTSPIYELDLKSYISALFFVAGQYVGTTDTKGKNLVVRRRNFEIHELLCKAQPVFLDWPNNFYSFLDWYRSQQNLQEAEGVRNWGRAYNKFKAALFARFAPPQFDFLRAAFREYMAIRRREHIIAVLPVVKEMIHSEEDNVNNPFMTGTEAKKALRITWKSLNELIAAGQLRAVIRTEENITLYLIERSGVDDLKDKLNDALSLSEAAKSLGVSIERAGALVRAKLIHPILGRTIGRTRNRKFSRTSIEGLSVALYKKARKTRAGKDRKLLTFEETVRRLGRLGIRIDILIQAILNDEIQPVIRDGCEKVDLSPLMFSTRDVSNLILTERHLRVGDVLKVSEASKALGLKASSVGVYIKQGVLQADVKPQMRRLGKVITRECLELFQSTYVWGHGIAPGLPTSPANIADILASRGIYPVIDRRNRKRSPPLFRKKDLEGVDLRVLLDEKRVNQQKRYYGDHLDVDRAAKFLQIDRTAVVDLVGRGILKGHRQLSNKKHDVDELLFSIYSLKRLVGRTHSFDGLVSAEVAASMLGKSKSNLNQYYVQTGRLKIARLNNVRVHLFEKRDVEALVESKDRLSSKTVLTPEAAEILGVCSTSVHRLIKAGLLKPVTGPSIDASAINRYLRSDVEKLHAEREAFKSRRVLEGKSPRFGRPPGPGRRPVQEVIGPQIDRLIKRWKRQAPDKNFTGVWVYRQLIEEGYQVKIATVYYCLQSRRKATSA